MTNWFGENWQDLFCKSRGRCHRLASSFQISLLTKSSKRHSPNLSPHSDSVILCQELVVIFTQECNRPSYSSFVSTWALCNYLKFLQRMGVVVTGTGLAQGYYLLGIPIMHHPFRPVKYFACIHMMDNHVSRLAALAPSRVSLWRKIPAFSLYRKFTALPWGRRFKSYQLHQKSFVILGKSVFVGQRRGLLGGSKYGEGLKRKCEPQTSRRVLQEWIQNARKSLLLLARRP